MMVLYTTGPEISLPGIKPYTFVASNISDANTLLDRAQRELDDRKNAVVNWRIDGRDVSAVHQEQRTFEMLALGDYVHVIDPEFAIDERVRLTEVQRNVTEPSDVRLKFEKRKQTLEDYLAEQAEKTEDLQGQQTDYLPDSRIYRGPGRTNPITDELDKVDDWEDGSSGNIDGGDISSDTIARLRLAKVIEDQTTSSYQLYQVKLLNHTDRSETSTTVDNCFVADDDADAMEVGDECLVLLPSRSQTDWHAVIINTQASVPSTFEYMIVNEGS